ncbi:single-stranded DNA-binding protein [Salinibacterium sp. SYSU T00001]|uniref:single-stranded DNA-binding protein n=1 Tax=Homoserinimonas sedimenticola TaxID=2986805 RepID=UPI0022360A12|nr:single-stranded DNA-binding protein [Salinibacterium sedimenticola]MCW4384733.1 single-stranded DNA-binding protein [Salinibacterium sedimenticola]
MTDTITLTGLVATEPKHITTNEGLPITSFRLASTQRRYDRSTGTWVDGDTNWYTVTAFRRLASNASVSLTKGQRVVVSGRLRLREWQSGDRSGLAVEVEADAIGHDLTWGTANFSRNSVVVSSPAEVSEEVPADGGGDGAADGWATPPGTSNGVPVLQGADAEKPF